MMTVPLIVLLVVIAVAALAVYWKMNSHSRNEGQFHVFRCPRCGQKLRYLTSKAGRAGMCPRCRQRWTFPTLSQLRAVDAEGQRMRVGKVPPRHARAGTSQR